MHIKTSDQEVLQLGIGHYSCNWGVHMCGLYESDQERDEIIFGFLRQGYFDGDLQLYSPVERSQDAFYQEFAAFCPECQVELHDLNILLCFPPETSTILMVCLIQNIWIAR